MVRDRVALFELLTEQQLAILRSKRSTNRVAKAISLAGVTQSDRRGLTEDELGLYREWIENKP